MEEQIGTIAKFSGAPSEDVVQWLRDIEEIFDRAQLRLTINTELSNGNHQLNLVNDNSIIALEDLEDKCLCESDQSYCTPVLVNIHDCDQLEQQGESVITLVSVKTDVEDVFETVAESIYSSTADNSLINSVLPQDIQYLSSDTYKPCQISVFNEIHTAYDWNQFNKNGYDVDVGIECGGMFRFPKQEISENTKISTNSI
ncbi:unnamed protein product [Rotaria sp. Silwood1]|nr:unnamed protein product [Rotaria sp. Silwood1]